MINFIIESISYITWFKANEWEWEKSIFTDEMISRLEFRILSKNPNWLIKIVLSSDAFLDSSYLLIYFWFFSPSDITKLKAVNASDSEFKKNKKLPFYAFIVDVMPSKVEFKYPSNPSE